MKILIVTTSHARTGGEGGAGRETGLWMAELSTPYYAFVDAGAVVDIASIAGGPVPIDPTSMEDEYRLESAARFLGDAEAMAMLHASRPIEAIPADAYDAIFLPGGHGTMWDLPTNAALIDLIAAMHAAGKVVSAVCHGPAGLVNVTDADGVPIVRGREVCAFTNSEEEAAGLLHAVPFLLEDRLRELGGLYRSAPDFQACAVRDGHLVTGQNPASCPEVSRLVLEAICDG
ncbi:type 1 glutamine amidotransferase domain-containing protein [Sphingomonas sp.]|uniref:type 1 glutamine amidotransferase domain-containing protein n=1 Tax=Sphingomonas sp. TaxID=28214 RepID=UPI000DB579F9|nr:type 1 glutamine amidotransferase domain-containing protein [Sphingomonas sp.]PZU11872.1 MAG: glutamine amidotransferase [Sphingomonas sp.]